MKKWLLPLFMLASVSAHAEDVLHIYNWNNYLAKETVKRFEAYCKCKVKQTDYGSMEEMLAKLNAGAKGYDVIVPTGFAIPGLIKQNLVRPLEAKQLPNMRNVNSAMMNSAFDKGNKYSVPYAFTTTLIGYNTEKLKELNIDPHSWAVIFDPKILAKIKGKVTVLDDPRELLAAALKYNGFSANSTNPAEWAKAKATILQAKPYWAAFNAQSYIKELTLGNIWVAHGYSNDMYQAQQDAKAAKRKFTISYVLQKQGNTLSVDSMMIHKNAPRPDLAHKFMNFMLDGKNAADLTNEIGSGNPNTAASASIRPELKKITPIFPDKTAMAKLEQLKDLDAKSRRDLSKLWTDVKVK